MKKSFLRAFIIAGLFSILIFGLNHQADALTTGGLTTTGSAYKTYEQFLGNRTPVTGKTDVNITWTEGGKTVTGMRTDFTDGSHVIVKVEGNTITNADLYDANGKKSTYQINMPVKEGANENNPTGGAYTSNPAPKDGGIDDALQTLMLATLMYGTKFIAWIVSWTGNLFDYVLTYTTTYPQSDNPQGGGLSTAIYSSWKIVRDFSNIILVFSLLYLGIKTIYEGQGFAEKRTLIGVILAAILINFSFFFVKDVAFNLSNVIGRQILEQTKLQQAGTDPSQASYSAALMGIVDPQQVLALNGYQGTWGANAVAINYTGTWDKVFGMMGQFLMFGFIVICMALVFLGSSLILLYRFFIFILLMIMAPIGLISTQIPWLKNTGKQWLDQLKKQTIFFPAFTIILYIVLYIVTTLASVNPVTSYNVGQVGSVDVASVTFQFLFNFILIIGFMVGILILPGRFSIVGASLMTNSGNFIANKVRNMPRRTLQRSAGAVAASTAVTGRYLAGNLVGDKVLQSKAAKRLATSDSGVARFLGQNAVRAGENLKGKTYDLRNADWVKGTGFGKGMGEGIKNWSAAVADEKDKYMKTQGKEAKLFGYDKMAQTQEAKIAIERASGERDKAANTLKEHRKELNDARLRGASIEDIKEKVQYVEDAEKELEKAELEVGKAKNIGDQKFLEHYKSRMSNRLAAVFKATKRASSEKIRKDLEDGWKKAGASSDKKKKKAEEKRTEKDLE